MKVEVEDHYAPDPAIPGQRVPRTDMTYRACDGCDETLYIPYWTINQRPHLCRMCHYVLDDFEWPEGV